MKYDRVSLYVFLLQGCHFNALLVGRNRMSNVNCEMGRSTDLFQRPMHIGPELQRGGMREQRKGYWSRNPRNDYVRAFKFKGQPEASGCTTYKHYSGIPAG